MVHLCEIFGFLIDAQGHADTGPLVSGDVFCYVRSGVSDELAMMVCYPGVRFSGGGTPRSLLIALLRMNHGALVIRRSILLCVAPIVFKCVSVLLLLGIVWPWSCSVICSLCPAGVVVCWYLLFALTMELSIWGFHVKGRSNVTYRYYRYIYGVRPWNVVPALSDVIGRKVSPLCEENNLCLLRVCFYLSCLEPFFHYV